MNEEKIKQKLIDAFNDKFQAKKRQNDWTLPDDEIFSYDEIIEIIMSTVII